MQVAAFIGILSQQQLSPKTVISDTDKKIISLVPIQRKATIGDTHVTVLARFIATATNGG